MTEYRVNLDIYNGPLDLLLYLIRRDEIDIHDIPIARITQQYCAYVETLRRIDPDLAGEFLVVAATLLEIKTRMLLPKDAVAEEQEAFDPRNELVRQLLEYKAFKDAAGELRQAASQQSLRFPRRPPELTEAEPAGKEMEEVQLWDLVEAFTNLMNAIGQTAPLREIIYDDTPIELHADDILDRLAREGDMTFRQVFTGRTSRMELVGLFLALLELIRRRRVYVEQEAVFGEIYVFLRKDAAAGKADGGTAAAAPEAAGTATAEPGARNQEPGPAAEPGQA